MACSTTSTCIVLCGKTGSGKTMLLEALESQGYPVIHLERLAAHRGSAFGDMLPLQQPAQNFFEEELERVLEIHKSAPYIFVEQKSSSIGKRKIPGCFYSKMAEGIIIELKVNEDIRVQNILQVYCNDRKQGFASGLKKITNRLPISIVAKAQAMLKAENYHGFIKQMLDYYDQAAGYNFYKEPHLSIIVTDNNPLNQAKQIIDALLKRDIVIS